MIVTKCNLIQSIYTTKLGFISIFPRQSRQFHPAPKYSQSPEREISLVVVVMDKVEKVTDLLKSMKMDRK